MSISIKDISRALLDVVFPRTCSVCGSPLASHEKHLCTGCLVDIPKTDFHLQHFNPMEQLFAGKVLIHRASGFFFYEKGSPYSNLLHDFKYRNLPQLAFFLASLYARELQQHHFFAHIHYIIPVPLHRSKLISRGYNQSEMIARGFSSVTGIPVLTDIIVAHHPHESQTDKGIYERWANTQGVFSAVNTHLIENKHVLIVDDVVTTGATLLSASLSISSVPGVTISLATLGVAVLG